ncbi:hypothetical protein EOM81_01620 [bacterium]|nr:hypothetical protein [bacterium]
MPKKKKVELDEFETELLNCPVNVLEGVNGKTAKMTFRKHSYSSTAPDDLPKRQQKNVAIENLLNLVRVAWGRERVEN